MARYHYSSYSSRRRKKRNMKFFTLAVIVIIVGIIILMRSRGEDEPAGVASEEDIVAGIRETQEPQAVRYKTELPSTTTPKVQPKPEPTPTPEPVATETIKATGITSGKAAILIAEAQKDESMGRIIAARDKLNSVLSMELNSRDMMDIKRRLAALAQKWLFSKDVYEKDTLTGQYKVRRGDLLETIAKKYKISYGILMTINNIKDARQLRADKTIKMVNGPFHTIVYRSTFKMDLYLQNTYVKSYDVGLGEAGSDTPTGLWLVKKGGKLIKPTWTDPRTSKTYVADEPDYPLGSRWIGFEGLEGNAKGRTGFAIHGTKEPETIGKRSSMGCIRLYNGDVIEVYKMLAEGLSQVRVVD